MLLESGWHLEFPWPVHRRSHVTRILSHQDLITEHLIAACLYSSGECQPEDNQE